MYRFSGTERRLEVLLVHPGGPFWKSKDDGAWVVPRGNVEENEELLTAAVREFSEETGIQSQQPYISLGDVQHRSGKMVHVWAFQGTCDPAKIRSNTFEMEWPPKSGKTAQFPEVDRADFFTIQVANRKILPAEQPFLAKLVEKFPNSVQYLESEAVPTQTFFNL